MKKVEKEKIEETPQEEVKANAIDLLSVDLGRDDLNALKEKLNEVISYLNER